MSPHEFWYEEEELLEVYITAYHERIEYEAWLHGKYTYMANLTSTSNTWGEKKDITYPEFKSILEEKNKETEDEKEVSKNSNEYISQFY